MRSDSPIRGLVLLECGIVAGGLSAAALLSHRPGTAWTHAALYGMIVLGAAVAFAAEWAISERLFRREMREMVAVMSRPEWRTNPDMSHPAVARWLAPRRRVPQSRRREA